MNILIGVHHFPPKYTSGAEWVAFSTASDLVQRGHTVKVFTVEDINDGQGPGIRWVEDTYQGVPVHRIFFDSSTYSDPDICEYNNPLIGQHFEEFLELEKPDVFHLFSGYLLTGRLLKICENRQIASLVTLTDFWFLCPRITMLKSNGEISKLPINAAACVRCLAEEKRRYLYLGKAAPGLMKRYWALHQVDVRKIEKRLIYSIDALNSATSIISPSRFLKEIYVQAGIDSDKIIFLRQGRDFPHLTDDLLQKTTSKNLRFGYLGQISWHKGVHLIVEAFQGLPDVPISLEIYGDTTRFPGYSSKLLRKAEKDPRIQFMGVYKNSVELSHVLQRLDVIIVPSVWYENSPNVILEALAHKTPLIVSDLGGMAELIQDGVNGKLFEVGNADSLAEKIKRLYDDPDLLKKYRDGIKPVQTMAEETDLLESIYQNMLSKTFETGRIN